jgi:hypothetical protein
MNLEVEFLKSLPRLFNALDTFIDDYGVYLYLVFVWLALAVIGWIFNGGLRRRMKETATPVIPVVIVMAQPPRQPEAPIIDIEAEQTWSDDGESTN